MRRVLVLAAPLLGLMAACVGQTHLAYHADVSARLSRPSSAEDPPPRAHPPYDVVPDQATAGHEVKQIYRPRPCWGDPVMELAATAYVSTSPGPKPWIIVLPIWGSSVYPSKKTVEWIFQEPDGADMNVLWIHGSRKLLDYPALKAAQTEADFFEALGRSTACIDSTVEDVRGFVDWIETQPGTDPKKIGLVGFSIGAIVGSIAMGRDPRLATGVLVVGGGHLDQIFCTCFGAEEVIRENCRVRFGWGPEEFAQKVSGPLAWLDPVLVAGSIDPSRVLYIDAGRDGCIPQSARDDLWEAMGRPERVTLDFGHKTSFLTMTFLGLNVTTRRIVHFLDRHLQGPDSQPAGVSMSREAEAEPR